MSTVAPMASGFYYSRNMLGIDAFPVKSSSSGWQFTTLSIDAAMLKHADYPILSPLVVKGLGVSGGTNSI